MMANLDREVAQIPTKECSGASFALLASSHVAAPTLTNGGLLGLLGSKLAPAAHTSRNTALKEVSTFSSHHPAPVKSYQIQRSSNQLVPHTRTILRSPSSYQNNTVLLNIVALARN